MERKNIDKMNDLIKLYTIEQKLGKSEILPREVILVRELADKKEHPRAEYILAWIYFYGQGLEKNDSKSVKYLIKSSRCANHYLKLKIGILFYKIENFKTF